MTTAMTITETTSPAVMPSTEQFLSELARLGIKLSLNGERLRCDAPKGVLTPALQAEVSKHKSAIIAHLQRTEHNGTPVVPPVAYPLSFGQRRLWFLDQLEGPNAAYNLPGAIRLTGVLDVNALTRALQTIVQRHAILRTTFHTVNGEPIQMVHAKTLQLEIIDLIYATVEEREAKLQQAVQAETLRPFDLTKDLMLRASLLRLIPQPAINVTVHPPSPPQAGGEAVPSLDQGRAREGADYVLQATMHHIASDAWSRRVFHDELCALYRAFVQGEPSPLPPLPMQYTDFVHWQQQWLQDATLAKQLAYWKNQLSGTLPLLTLPHDYPRPTQPTFTGHKALHPLPAALGEALKQVSRRHQATLFMTMLAAFKLLLMRLSGQEDLIIGTPVTRRNRTELEGIIGFFINTVVLRTDLSGNPTFAELLARIKRTTLDAYANQDLPFEKLVEEIQPARTANRNPLFQVWFNMFPGPEPIQLPGVTSAEITPGAPPSMFDLIIYIQDGNANAQSGLEISTVYNPQLFTAARIQALLAQLQWLLEQIAADPTASITAYSLVPGATASHLPDPRLPLPAAWSAAVHEQFRKQAQQAPQQIAVSGEGLCLRYGEVEALSNQLAHYLLAQGIEREAVVAIYAERTPVLAVTLLGILKAGAAFTMLDAAYPPARLLAYCEQAQPAFLLHLAVAGALTPELAARFADNHGLLPNTLPALYAVLQAYPNTPPAVTVTPEQRMYVAFTSGSTGQPKAIVGTHRPVAHFVDWQRQTFALTSQDRFSLLSGLAHDPLLRDLFTPLTLGATLCVPTPAQIDPLRLADWMTTQAIMVAHLTPPMGQLLTADQTRVNHTLRYLFFGGDQLTPAQLQRIHAFAPQATCVNFYGATETPQAMGYALLDPQTASATLPLGRGIDGVQLLVVNQAGHLCGIGEIGEIVVRTPYLTEGYWGDVALTQQRFIANPWRQESNNASADATDALADRLYKTGDLGRYLPDGQVTFVGRADTQVKIRGFRIELSEIETALTQHPAVQSAFVTTYNDSAAGQQLVAYLVLSPQSAVQSREDEQADAGRQTEDALLQALRADLQSKLPGYMTPSAFVLVPTMPLTRAGKIDRRALPAPTFATGRSPAQIVAPRTLLETQLTTLWETVLQRHPLSIADSFFEQGGHSLLAVQLLTKVQQQFGKAPTLAAFLRSPTIEQVACLLQQQAPAQPWTPVVTLQKGGSLPPFFCVHGADGYVHRFYYLARALGAEQPFYGLQAVDLHGQAPPLLSLPALATYYRQALQSVRPVGPYHLGGYSFGAKVAYEMARQLIACGATVASLTLIDGAAPQLLLPQQGANAAEEAIDEAELLLYLVQQTAQWYGKALTLAADTLQGLDFPVQVQVVNSALAAAQLPPLPQDQRQVLNNLQIYKRHIEMPYRPSGALPVPTALFYTQERFDREYAIHQEPTLGWRAWLAAPVTTALIPGNHVTLLAEPHVQIFAQKLDAWLGSAA